MTNTMTMRRRTLLLLAAFAVCITALTYAAPAPPAQADTREVTQTYLLDCRPKKMKLELRARYNHTSGMVSVPLAWMYTPWNGSSYSITRNNYITADYYRTMVTRYHSVGYTYGYHYFMSTALSGVPFYVYVRKTCYGTAPAPQ